MPRGRPKKVVETPVEVKETVEVKKPGRGRPKKSPEVDENLVTHFTEVAEKIENKKEFNNKKLLLVVDMQNDFISGSLANPAAEKIVKPMCEFIKNYDGIVIFTQDTHHDEDYFDSMEGKKLPVKHCIINTEGWQIDKRLIAAAEESGRDIKTAWKFYFGGGDALKTRIENEFKYAPDQIDLVGTCTDICVVSNALQLKTLFPDTEFNVWGNLCAGLTTKKHNAALEVMSSCQINILNYEKPVQN